MKLTRLIIFLFAFTLMFQSPNAFCDDEGISDTPVTSNNKGASGLTVGSGGSNTGGASSIQIDEFMGAATNSITIPVPPGRGGIEPQLTLNYNSNRKNPNSWVGYGWDLDMGAIERTPKDGNLDYEEGTTFESHFAGQSEELYLAKADVNAADYDITLLPNQKLDLYRARVDNAFNTHLFIRSTSPAIADGGWVVLDKSGRRYVFGADPTSRVGEESKRAALKWLLQKVSDPNGNVMNVIYDWYHILKSILYEGAKIKFNSSSDRAYFPQFRQLFQTRDNVTLLDSIEIRDTSNGDNRLQEFVLSYNMYDENSFPLLGQIQQFGKTDSVSLPPTKFTYYKGDKLKFRETPVEYTVGAKLGDEVNPGVQNWEAQFADMNGDGLVDQVLGFKTKKDFKVLYNTGKKFVDYPDKSTWADPFEWSGNDNWNGTGQGRVVRFPDYGKDQDIFLFDINGDALPDRIRGGKDNTGGFFDVALNTGTKWTNPVRWTDPVDDGDNAGRTTKKVGLMDMNGDGLADRVVGKPDNNGFAVYLNNGHAFETNPQFWLDPLSAYPKDSDYPVGELYKYNSKGYLSCSTRDLNGDGLPDRVLRAKIQDSVTGEIRWGFSVFINKNGKEWAYPDLNAQGNTWIDDDHLFLDDPLALNPDDPDNKFAGFFTSRHDLIDMNGDGYLDRIVGITPTQQDGSGGHFKVYLYNGLKPGEVSDYFNPTPIVIDDPVGNITKQEWPGPGSAGKISLSTNSSDASYDTSRFTLFQDMNGDGYPDRLIHTHTPATWVDTDVIDPVTGKKKQVEVTAIEKAVVHYFDANPIEFEDTPDKKKHTVNQPLYVLKGISSGVGIDSAVEYVPSTEKLASTSPGFTDQRFLPFNTYIVHKAYSTDYTMDASQKADAQKYAEGARHPGMRWLRYDYNGGHLFVRKPTQLLHLYQRFVGFHEITKVPIHLENDGWQPYHTVTRYMQPLGEQDDPLILKSILNTFFDPVGYGHFALTGKPYFQKVILNNQDLTVEKSQWDLKNAKPDSLNCNGSCIVNVASQSKIVYELGGGIRGTQKEFQYDEIGNLTGNSDFQISEDGVQKTPLSSTQINYVPGTAFPKKNILDRVASQTQFKAGETGHTKSFEYDDKGNPVTETFVSTDAAVPSQNNAKTFGAFGNLAEATSFDGVVKKYSYDAKNLFPIEETTSAGGLSLTTKREFNRLLGKASQEIGPNGVGKKVESDDFGRPLNQYLLPANGGAPILDKKYVYTDVVPVKFGLWNINLSRVDVYDIKPDYPAVSAQKPVEITFTDGAGGPLQKCSLSEKGNYRVVQSRVSVGGQVETATEPVFKDTCPFYSELLTTKIITTKKDFMGRPLSIDYPEGDGTDSPVLDASITYYADASGHMIKKTVQGVQSREEEFDITDRLIRVRDTGGSDIFYEYNVMGDLISVADNKQTLTTIYYDSLGRKTQMTDANLGTWKYEYDFKGRLSKQTDAKGQKINNYYDDLGRVITKVIWYGDGTLDRQEKYTYDNGSNGYDVKLGELYQVEEFNSSNKLMRSTRFGYEPAFRSPTRISRKIVGVGEFTQEIFNDVKGRVVKNIYPGGDTIYYTYNLTGGLMKSCNTANCTSEVYQSVDPNTGYDVYGSLLKETFGNGVTNDYEYYPNSHRLKQRTITSNQVIASQRQYTFDGYSNITALADPQKLKGSAAWSIINYDNLNRLTSYKSTQTNKTESLNYDSRGNILKNSASYANKDYEYTSSRPHAVTKIGDEQFLYDANGNMLSDAHRGMTYNAQNLLKKVVMNNGVSVEYEYDYTGARVLKKSTSKDPMGKITVSQTHYLGETLEIKDNIVSLHINVGSQRIASKGLGDLKTLAGIGAGTLRDSHITPDEGLYVYIPWMMLAMLLFVIASFRPVVFLPLCKGESEGVEKLIYLWQRYTQSLHEALNQFHIRSFAKTICTILIFTFTTLQPLTQIAIAGDTGTPLKPIDDEKYFVYYQSDHLGSTNIITEGKTNGLHSGITYPKGSLVQRIEYGPYGQEQFVLNPNLKFDPRYTGQQYDVETGLYYYKARYYNPVLARFIQADTVVPDAKNLQAYNRYAYAANNPLKYTDPSGHSFWGWFKKLAVPFISALVGVLITVLTAGALAPAGITIAELFKNLALLSVGEWMLAGAAGGLVSGALAGAMTGGVKGALLGALMGAVGGALMSAGNAGLFSAGVTSGIGRTAIFASVGAGLSYAQGGWQGLLTFGAGMLGAFAGGLAGGAISDHARGLGGPGAGAAAGGHGGGNHMGASSSDNGALANDPPLEDNSMLDGLTDGMDLSLKALLPDPRVHFASLAEPNFMEQYFGPKTWLNWGGAGTVIGGAYGFGAGVGIGAFGSGGVLLAPAGYGGMIVGSVTGFKIGFIGARSIYGIYDWIYGGAKASEFTKAWP